MKKSLILFVAILSLSITISAQSNDVGGYSVNPTHKSAGDSLKTKQTIGIAIDLLPPIMSATAGHFGYSAQLWYGYKKNRVRGVIAGFYMPDRLMGNEDFKDLHTTATAIIYDRFRNDNFKGWWLGAGFEIWNNTITSKIDNHSYKYKDYVVTTGIGYLFKLYRNFYIEPWGAVHYVLNNETVVVDKSEYQTKRFQGELSLKIGWHF